MKYEFLFAPVLILLWIIVFFVICLTVNILLKLISIFL